MKSLKAGYRAVVAGSTGGIGGAFVELLRDDERCGEVIGLSRSTQPAIDFSNETTISRAADAIGGEIDLFVDATGFLSDESIKPEKSLRAIDPANMQHLFEANTIGPALLLKHFSAIMPRKERAIFATLSARVGSIGDNRAGGWYAYRASKAALNMILKCAAIELGRNREELVCAALHPGTVATGLSDPFAADRERLSPIETAEMMLSVLDRLRPEQTGSFFAYDGQEMAW